MKQNTPAKHEWFRQMTNGLVAHVELEHEIVKWTSSIAISLALMFAHKAISHKVHGPTRSENARYLLAWVYRERCEHILYAF